MAKKPLEIDMCAGSQLRDTQGEMLSVEGADISELLAGRGRINADHGKGFYNCLGTITGAKKIFKREDCENQRQEYYWDKIKAPYVYVKARLFDDEDHSHAKAAAAIIRNIHKTDLPLKMKASVEGGVLARGISDPSLLARTKIHSVALTFVPANNATLVEPLNLDKSATDEAADMELIKSVIHLAQTNVPSFRHITRDASATKVQNNLLKLVDLMKDLGIEGDITIPSKRQILEKALQQKVYSNMTLIREQIAVLKQEELEKANIKNALAAAGMGAAMAMSPTSTTSVDPQGQSQVAEAPSVPKRTHQQVYEEVAKKYPLLGAIGQIESSGGTNLDHPEINGKILKDFYGIGAGDGKSMHAGMRAGGAYGMMPMSAAFILKKDPELAKKYPKLVEAAKDVHKNHKVFTDRFNSDPDADADFAVALFNRNKSKTRSPEQLAYSWLHGLKGSWNQYKSGGKNSFVSNPYVKSVIDEYSKHRDNAERKPALSKALTAGYGGAAAPSDRMSGSVIQTESLDQGRPGFKFVTCDHCGKEQVYSKHQVRCRECGHGMSFEKIARVMLNNK